MILDGKNIKSKILDELKEKVSLLKDNPSFVVIQVGNNEASNVYIKQKKNMAEYIGYNYQHIKLDDDVTNDMVLEIIDKLNNDKNVHGVMVQMPLPTQLDEGLIQNAVLPEKDIDGLSDINMGKLAHNKEALFSCTPYGIMEIFKRYEIDVQSKNVVIVGRSNLVGRPMSMMLLNAGATVTITHSKTKDLKSFTKNADILIVAVGKPKLITKDMIKEDSIIVDVGITRTENGLCGDVDYENVKDIVKYITPVPGGVGPMTVAMLAMNVLNAYKIQNE